MMMVMVMMMQGTILTRAHKNLDPEHESTKALTPELRLQYQRVREIDTKSGTEDNGPPDDDDHGDADEGLVRSCVALDLMMMLLILMLVIMMMSVIVVMMVLSKLVLNWTS